jgi:hypothetical protein
VNSLMCPQVSCLGKGFCTLGTAKQFFSRVSFCWSLCVQ